MAGGIEIPRDRPPRVLTPRDQPSAIRIAGLAFASTLLLASCREDAAAPTLAPAPTLAVAATAGPPPVPTPGEQQRYIVREGDTLSPLASAYGGCDPERKPLSDRDRLFVGQELVIPPRSRDSSAPGPRSRRVPLTRSGSWYRPLTPLAAASTPRPLRVKEVMPMSSHGTRGITVEAARRRHGCRDARDEGRTIVRPRSFASYSRFASGSPEVPARSRLPRPRRASIPRQRTPSVASTSATSSAPLPAPGRPPRRARPSRLRP